jgi:hypothetical protein
VLVEEMKKTYNIERGSHGIIIKRVSDVAMRMATKLWPTRCSENSARRKSMSGLL